MFAEYVCSVSLQYMFAEYVCRICLQNMFADYVCRIFLHNMFAEYCLIGKIDKTITVSKKFSRSSTKSKMSHSRILNLILPC